MTEFLRSIRSDLLSRRLLPLVVLLAVGLLAAVGYALSGGSSAPPRVQSASLPSAPAPSTVGSLPVSVAPANPDVAVSETPGGARYQSQDPTRDPFTPLPEPEQASSNRSSGSPGSGKSSSGSSAASTGSSSKGTSAGGQSAPAPSQPAKPAPLYVVTAELALGPTSPGQPVTVTPYDALKPHEPLPSKQDVRLIFERVTADGKGAIFKLAAAPILHGPGLCLPSASECQSIDLAAGQVEELEYVEPDGQTVSYALKVVAITKVVVRANASRVKRGAHAARAERRAHAALLPRDAHVALAHR